MMRYKMNDFLTWEALKSFPVFVAAITAATQCIKRYLPDLIPTELVAFVLAGLLSVFITVFVDGKVLLPEIVLSVINGAAVACGGIITAKGLHLSSKTELKQHATEK